MSPAQHTPRLLRLEGKRNIVDEYDCYLEPLGIFIHEQISEDDANRLMASWNACADVPLELLAESPAPFSELRAQRDALLASARQAEKWIAQQMLGLGWPQERIDSPPEGSHLFNLRAAIAKATGQKGGAA